MRQSRRFEDEPTTTKSLIIFGLIFIMFFTTSIALTSYPQHLGISNNTKIADVTFLGNNSVIIKGNQVQLNPGEIIPIEGAGRGYIKLTGNQVQIGKTNYPEAIRIIVSKWYQQVLFTQYIGKFQSNQTAQIIIDETSFVLTPLSQDAISVTATDISGTKKQNHYNIIFKQGEFYINENGIMLKFKKAVDTITVNTVGLDRHTRIVVRVI